MNIIAAISKYEHFQLRINVASYMFTCEPLYGHCLVCCPLNQFFSDLVIHYIRASKPANGGVRKWQKCYMVRVRGMKIKKNLNEQIAGDQKQKKGRRKKKRRVHGCLCHSTLHY